MGAKNSTRNMAPTVVCPPAPTVVSEQSAAGSDVQENAAAGSVSAAGRDAQESDCGVSINLRNNTSEKDARDAEHPVTLTPLSGCFWKAIDDIEECGGAVESILKLATLAYEMGRSQRWSAIEL